MREKRYSDDYTLIELMTVCGARELKNGELVFVGTGMPFLSAMLAKKTHAPKLKYLCEGGQYDANPTHVPYSVGDPVLTPKAAQTGMFVVTFTLSRGEVDVGFISGAQVDKFGNVNSTVIGDYLHPKVRLPGSGGANPIGSFCKRTIIIMIQEKRRFVEKVDFITTPGYLSGPGAREKVGLPPGGPMAVISTMGVFRFDPLAKEMYLDTYHPGITIKQIKENVGWDLKVHPNVHETEKPTEDEIKILRQLDSEGVFLKREELFQKLTMR